MSQDQETAPHRFVAAAEKAMSQTLGGTVRLGDVEVLRDFGYPKVLRCQVLEAPLEAGLDAGAKVVVKRCGARGDGSYDPAQAQQPWGGLFSEWAGTQFLQSLDAEPPLGPRFLGGDLSTGIVVVEDLGDGDSLANVLQGDSPERLEAGLLQYCASLGRLHAATVGRAGELERAWSNLGQSWSAIETPYRQAQSWVQENLTPFRESCAALGVSITPRFEAEARGVWQEMAQPGPFGAFTPGDTCPDNHRLAVDGYVRFFDFEACGFRHVLLDAAYPFVPFPTCWCVQRFPASLAPRMSDAYRRELVKGCPAAGDDERFSTALAQACASWAISAVSWNLNEAMEDDKASGLASLRQRVVLHLDAFVETAGWLDKLPALHDTAGALGAKLRVLWGEETQTPFYPALR